MDRRGIAQHVVEAFVGFRIALEREPGDPRWAPDHLRDLCGPWWAQLKSTVAPDQIAKGIRQFAAPKVKIGSHRNQNPNLPARDNGHNRRYKGIAFGGPDRWGKNLLELI